MNKKDVRERLWVAVDGSVYCEDLDDMKVDFTGKTIKVKRAIAFNVGRVVAVHMCETHNAHVMWKRKNAISIPPDYSGSMAGIDLNKVFEGLK